MKIIRRKAAFPPLGLLTIAAMLPESWGKRLVDLNVRQLTDEDIGWADRVLVSAMITQRESAKEVILRCKKQGKKVVAGGPLFSTGQEEFSGVDHFVVGEAENILHVFLNDLQEGRAKKVYKGTGFPDIVRSPKPLWELIDISDYVALSIQNSRGCPFDCEFCNITEMNGKVPRVKSVEQFFAELDEIYQTGFRGMVLVVDDNFIGDKPKAKGMLSELIKWQRQHGFPFSFSAQASINLADDAGLMELMVQAGFDQVFLGIETPSSAGLAECNKRQNQRRDMVASIKRVLNHGLHPLGGFIVGFDSDDPGTIFKAQIKLIQESGVVVAMMGLLQALPGTKLSARLLREDRLLGPVSGNNTDCSLSFKPRMAESVLLEGFKGVLRAIYSPKGYYQRMCTFLDEYNPKGVIRKRMNWLSFKAFAWSIWYIGLTGDWLDKWYYWKMLFVAFFKYRKAFPEAVAMLIYGSHLKRVAKQIYES